MWHMWETGGRHMGFRCGNLRETGHFEGLGLDRKIIKIVLQDMG
jgi:hypothetical protein